MTTTVIPASLGEIIREDAARKSALVELDDAARADVRAAQRAAATCARLWGITHDSALSAIRAGVNPGDEAAVRAFCIEEWERQGEQERAACRDGLIAATDDRIPPRFAGATVTDDRVGDWVAVIIAQARAASRIPGIDFVTAGPSLLIAGPVGTGKTYQAYGAVRALAAASVRVQWVFITAADLYGALRPRAGVDSEAEFRRIAGARLLILDDLGSAKPSEWTEEVDYRLVNDRYERQAATIFTTNMPPRELAGRLGQRATSRLNEMSTTVPLVGRDRRITRKAALCRDSATQHAPKEPPA
jgi:DNA replication protein DnaC